MGRMRTIEKAYKMVKELDPDTEISPFLIRKLAEQRKISVTKTGCKMLINVDTLFAFLKGEPFTPVFIDLG